MDLIVEYDSMKDQYDIRIDLEIDGLAVYSKKACISEIIDQDTAVEYMLHDMLMSAMKMVSEAKMPELIKQFKGAIKDKSESYNYHGTINGHSVKFGSAVTNVIDPKAMSFSDAHHFYIPDFLSKYVDLNQKVDLPKQFWVEGKEKYFVGVTLSNAIQYLNDSQHWSFDQIADWLETLDIDIDINWEGGE